VSDEHPFENFEANLREVDPELDGLEPPATAEAVDAVETQLSIKLPPSFSLWLQHYNGGTLYNTTIYGIEADDDFDLAEVNLRDRDEGLPTHLVAFANALSGDVYCFDTSLADDAGEAPVFLLDPEEGTLASVAASFNSWLERLPRLEAELAEVRGPQIPQPYCLIAAARSHPTTVRADGDGIDRALVTAQHNRVLGRVRSCQIPQPQRSVEACRCEPVAVRANRHRENLVLVTGQENGGGSRALRAQIPQSSRVITAPRREPAVVRCRHDMAHPRAVTA